MPSVDPYPQGSNPPGVRINVVVDDSPPRPGERSYPPDDGYWRDLATEPLEGEAGYRGFTTQEAILRERCGDAHCPIAACGRGFHIPIYVYLMENSPAFEWLGPITFGKIHWMGMDHFLHMLQFADMGGWTEYEIYTVNGSEDGWEVWHSGYDYFVSPEMPLLIMRKRGLDDLDCPGLSTLISRYHTDSDPPQRYRAPL